MKRVFNILVALDIFLFALVTLGRSRRNETASSAAWRLELDGRWQGRLLRPLIDWMFSPFERDHCRKSWENEQLNGVNHDVFESVVVAGAGYAARDAGEGDAA